MDTAPLTAAKLAGSVIAVPPLARDADFRLAHAENARIIRHIEAGGVRTLLYGGNAVLAHVAPGEYAELLGMLRDTAGPDTLVIPSVGPGYGMMMDQARILRGCDFPAAMVLPSADPSTPAGLATAIGRFASAAGRPAILYLRREGTIDTDVVRRMVADGAIACVKYAVPRADTAVDPYLRELVDAIGPGLVVSGFGEQPALVHMRNFGLSGFTAGCVCIAPRLSSAFLAALRDGNWDAAEALRRRFQPLESIRDAVSPVRVLHEAVQLAGIADTGPITPPLSPLDASERAAVERAARELLAAERAPPA